MTGTGAPVRRALAGAIAFLAVCAAAQVVARALETRGYEFAAGFAGAAVILTGVAAIRLTAIVLFRILLPALRLAVARIAEDVAVAASCVAWAMLYLRAAGLDLGNLVTASALVTAVVAFAMQDTLGNLLGGLFLEFDRSIRTGDWVRLDDVSGRVVEVRWRHSAILTRNGERVIVPNSALMKARFTVIGNPDEAPVRWRRWVHFDVDPAARSAGVIEAALAAVLGAEISGVARDPAPDCILLEATATRFRYALRYWLTDPARDDAVDSAVRQHVVASLQRAGIALSRPEYFVHEIEEGPGREARLRERDTARRVAALRALPLFASLTDAEAVAVAGRLLPAPFAAGDVVTRQGAVAHWLYLLVEGGADIWLETPGAARRKVAELGAGSVFGEMGMMTGEPRRATVTARTDLQCYRLDKSAFADILHARPELAEGMAQVLATRAGELRLVAAEAQAAASRPHEQTLVDRIRSFFGLQA